MQRGQGTFEYVLLLGGVLLIVVLALVVLQGNFLQTSSGVSDVELKKCRLSAQSSASCINSDGTFNGSKPFDLLGYQANPVLCNCSDFDPDAFTVPVGAAAISSLDFSSGGFSPLLFDDSSPAVASAYAVSLPLPKGSVPSGVIYPDGSIHSLAPDAEAQMPDGTFVYSWNSLPSGSKIKVSPGSGDPVGQRDDARSRKTQIEDADALEQQASAKVEKSVDSQSGLKLIKSKDGALRLVFIYSSDVDYDGPLSFVIPVSYSFVAGSFPQASSISPDAENPDAALASWEVVHIKAGQPFRIIVLLKPEAGSMQAVSDELDAKIPKVKSNVLKRQKGVSCIAVSKSCIPGGIGGSCCGDLSCDLKGLGFACQVKAAASPSPSPSGDSAASASPSVSPSPSPSPEPGMDACVAKNQGCALTSILPGSIDRKCCKGTTCQIDGFSSLCKSDGTASPTPKPSLAPEPTVEATKQPPIDVSKVRVEESKPWEWEIVEELKAPTPTPPAKVANVAPAPACTPENREPVESACCAGLQARAEDPHLPNSRLLCQKPENAKVYQVGRTLLRFDDSVPGTASNIPEAFTSASLPIDEWVSGEDANGFAPVSFSRDRDGVLYLAYRWPVMKKVTVQIAGYANTFYQIYNDVGLALSGDGGVTWEKIPVSMRPDVDQVHSSSGPIPAPIQPMACNYVKGQPDCVVGPAIRDKCLKFEAGKCVEYEEKCEPGIDPGKMICSRVKEQVPPITFDIPGYYSYRSKLHQVEFQGMTPRPEGGVFLYYRLYSAENIDHVATGTFRHLKSPLPPAVSLSNSSELHVLLVDSDGTAKDTLVSDRVPANLSNGLRFLGANGGRQYFSEEDTLFESKDGIHLDERGKAGAAHGRFITGVNDNIFSIDTRNALFPVDRFFPVAGGHLVTLYGFLPVPQQPDGYFPIDVLTSLKNPKTADIDHPVLNKAFYSRFLGNKRSSYYYPLFPVDAYSNEPSAQPGLMDSDAVSGPDGSLHVVSRWRQLYAPADKRTRLFYQFYPASVFDPSLAHSVDQVLLFSKASCPSCDQVRKWISTTGEPFQERGSAEGLDPVLTSEVDRRLKDTGYPLTLVRFRDGSSAIISGNDSIGLSNQLGAVLDPLEVAAFAPLPGDETPKVKVQLTDLNRIFLSDDGRPVIWTTPFGTSSEVIQFTYGSAGWSRKSRSIDLVRDNRPEVLAIHKDLGYYDAWGDVYRWTSLYENILPFLSIKSGRFLKPLTHAFTQSKVWGEPYVGNLPYLPRPPYRFTLDANSPEFRTAPAIFAPSSGSTIGSEGTVPLIVFDRNVTDKPLASKSDGKKTAQLFSQRNYYSIYSLEPEADKILEPEAGSTLNELVPLQRLRLPIPLSSETAPVLTSKSNQNDVVFAKIMPSEDSADAFDVELTLDARKYLKGGKLDLSVDSVEGKLTAKSKAGKAEIPFKVPVKHVAPENLAYVTPEQLVFFTADGKGVTKPVFLVNNFQTPLTISCGTLFSRVVAPGTIARVDLKPPAQKSECNIALDGVTTRQQFAAQPVSLSAEHSYAERDLLSEVIPAQYAVRFRDCSDGYCNCKQARQAVDHFKELVRSHAGLIGSSGNRYVAQELYPTGWKESVVLRTGAFADLDGPDDACVVNFGQVEIPLESGYVYQLQLSAPASQGLLSVDPLAVSRPVTLLPRYSYGVASGVESGRTDAERKAVFDVLIARR